MHIKLHPRFADSVSGLQAKALTSACVHCGFCLTSCPTYLDTRDERDSPRGRIYLIKNLLESGSAGETTQTHLDRCLTCRNCETACPSGMQYGELLDIGRELLEKEVPRTRGQNLIRRMLRYTFSRPHLLRPLLRLGQATALLLPQHLRRKIPRYQANSNPPVQQHARRMLLLEGCVQKAATPATNASARRVMHKLGVSLLAAPDAGCCGALDYHLGAQRDGLERVRRNIDSWWPFIEDGAEAIISSATGCGAMLVDYGRLLADDPDYGIKAKRVSELAMDIGEVLLEEDLGALDIDTNVGRVGTHAPCSLQHALQKPRLVEDILKRAGFALAASEQLTLCCGSAGSYSIFHPQTSERLRDRALETLTADEPVLIATANIGCQLHLQSGAGVPVRHWIELLDQPVNSA